MRAPSAQRTVYPELVEGLHLFLKPVVKFGRKEQPFDKLRVDGLGVG